MSDADIGSLIHAGAESRAASPAPATGRRPSGCLWVVVKVVAAVLVSVVAGIVALLFLYDREVHREAVDSIEDLRASVHTGALQALSESPQARGAALTEALRHHLGSRGGVYVFQGGSGEPDQAELLVSLMDAQSLNAFIGYDWVACIRVDVTAGDTPTVASTEVSCPTDVVFTYGTQEDSWRLEHGVPSGAEVIHLPPLRERV